MTVVCLAVVVVLFLQCGNGALFLCCGSCDQVLQASYGVWSFYDISVLDLQGVCGILVLHFASGVLVFPNGSACDPSFCC